MLATRFLAQHQGQRQLVLATRFPAQHQGQRQLILATRFPAQHQGRLTQCHEGMRHSQTRTTRPRQRIGPGSAAKAPHWHAEATREPTLMTTAMFRRVTRGCPLLQTVRQVGATAALLGSRAQSILRQIYTHTRVRRAAGYLASCRLAGRARVPGRRRVIECSTHNHKDLHVLEEEDTGMQRKTRGILNESRGGHLQGLRPQTNPTRHQHRTEPHRQNMVGGLSVAHLHRMGRRLRHIHLHQIPVLRMATRRHQRNRGRGLALLTLHSISQQMHSSRSNGQRKAVRHGVHRGTLDLPTRHKEAQMTSDESTTSLRL